MESDPLDVGSTSYIVPTSFGVVKQTHRAGRKRSAKALLPLEERAIHSLCEKILNHPFYTRLKVPKLSSDTTRYEMERIDTRQFRTVGEVSIVVQDELTTFFGEMELKGIVMRDYELFEQDDGSVIILDFNRCLIAERPSLNGSALGAESAAEHL